jgi:hypothetical protein
MIWHAKSQFCFWRPKISVFPPHCTWGLGYLNPWFCATFGRAKIHVLCRLQGFPDIPEWAFASLGWTSPFREFIKVITITKFTIIPERWFSVGRSWRICCLEQICTECWGSHIRNGDPSELSGGDQTMERPCIWLPSEPTRSHASMSSKLEVEGGCPKYQGETSGEGLRKMSYFHTAMSLACHFIWIRIPLRVPGSTIGCSCRISENFRFRIE